MRKEILIAGAGGQGVQLLGRVLAEILNKEGLLVSLKSNYGPEARGGKSFTEIVIKETPEDWPGVMKPDILVAMSQEGYNFWIPKTSLKTKVFFDPDTLREILPAKAEHFPVPATKIANSLGSRMVANMVMLGALLAKTGAVKPELAVKVIKEEFRGKNPELNEKAFRLGFRLRQDYDG